MTKLNIPWSLKSVTWIMWRIISFFPHHGCIHEDLYHGFVGFFPPNSPGSSPWPYLSCFLDLGQLLLAFSEF